MSVPALRKGLRILEMAARAGGVRFSEVQHEFGFPKASAARLLNELRELGYLRKDKDSGGYFPGASTHRIAPYSPLPDRLCRFAGQQLGQLRDELRCTVLLMYWDGTATLALAKETHPESVVMQHVGDRRTDLLCYPWGWIFADSVSPERVGELQNESGGSRDWFQHVDEGLAGYRRAGYAYEDESGRSESRRGAAPIRLGDGEVVGALCTSNMPHQLPDNAIATHGERLITAAAEVSRLLVGQL